MARDLSNEEYERFEQLLHHWTRRDFLRRSGGALAFTAMATGGLAALLEACSSGTSSAPGPSVSPVKGGSLTEAGPSDILAFNPLNSTGSAGQVVIPMLYDGLYSWNGAGDLVPRIASGLPQASADGLTYTIQLKKNVTWTDGKPLDASDVVFTYNLITDPQGQYSSLTANLRPQMKPVTASVTNPDPYTVVFKLGRAYAPFPSLFLAAGILPQHVFGSMTASQIANSPFLTSGPQVTSGAFKFVQWQKGDHITLARNDAYYAGAPLLDNFIYKPIPQTTTLINQLTTGEVDVAKVYSPGAYDQLKALPNLTTMLIPEASVLAFWFQQDPGKPGGQALQDKAVRQALLYGLDRAGINNAAYARTGAVQDSDWYPGSWAYDPNPKHRYAFDAKKAAQLLDDAGWKVGSSGIREKGGVQLKFEVNPPDTGPEYQQACQVAQQNWQALGVGLTVRIVTFAEFQATIATTRNFSVLIQRITLSNDPDATLWFSSKSLGPGPFSDAFHYINPQVDSLLDQATATTDRTKRKQLYLQIQDILSEDVPVAPICSLTDIWAYNNRVHGMGPGQIGQWTFQYARDFMNKVFVTKS